MAVAIGGKRLTLPASGDLSDTGQFHFATVDANGRGAVAAANELCVGVGQNKPGAQDREYSIQYEGVSKLILGGTVNEGDRLTSDATVPVSQRQLLLTLWARSRSMLALRAPSYLCW